MNNVHSSMLRSWITMNHIHFSEFGFEVEDFVRKGGTKEVVGRAGEKECRPKKQ